jgi:hypothetical protein
MAQLVFALMAASTTACVLLVRHTSRRAKARHWLPLHDAMRRDAATLPSTYLAQILTRPEPEAGGQVMATDLINGACGALFLPGMSFPTGAVVCFRLTADGPQINAWMTGRLWNACARRADRDRRRSARAAAREERARRHRAEREIRAAAGRAVAEAEQILRQQSSR